MNHGEPAYGLWLLVLFNSAVFILFAFSFFKPATARDWRTFGAFAAFVVPLFVEMYGFPLTLYLLAGWLQSRYPELDLFSHNSGHLWSTVLGEQGDPHFPLPHNASYVLLGYGFYLLATAWPGLCNAQRQGALATSGPYARIRHPQYAAFVLILLGFLLQWPTLLTLVMFPILLANNSLNHKPVFMFQASLQEPKNQSPEKGRTYPFLPYSLHNPRPSLFL